jgi:endoglucanase
MLLLPATAWAAAPPPSSKWFVDQESDANQELASLRAQGRQSQAALVARIADQPRFAWFGPFAPPDRMREYVDRARAAGKIPLIALFNVEARECEDLGTARRFYVDAARAIGNRPAIVAFEPDSLGTMPGPRSAPACYNAIRYGIGVFAKLPKASTFVEASASDWEGATRMAPKLRRVGACRVGGILLNATHADWTNANIRYGHALDRLLPCHLRILVNTAENGRGPTSRTVPQHWCDRRQRYGLGPPPAFPSGHKDVLFGYVNRPGYTQKCYDAPVRWALYRALNLARKFSAKEG